MVLKIPKIAMSDYFYELPDERIATFPLTERDQSKLLVWEKGNISESVFSGIDRFLPGGSLLVSNNTKVIHARIVFHRPTGARIEIFCLEPFHPADYQLSFQQQGSTEWRCLVGNAKKWKEGILEQRVSMPDERTLLFRAEMTEKDEQGFTIRFSWNSADTFATVLEAAGRIPIPPYLNRESEESDNLRYQTLYAKIDGSVAAPTAGLHFTPAVLQKLALKNIGFTELTLHVGAGTFQPVKTEEISGHTMHTETVIITKKLIRQLLRHRGELIAVGTTSVRSLESIYWLGIKASTLTPGQMPHVEQWEPYQPGPPADTRQSLLNILRFMEQHALEHLNFTTSIIIVPGYVFRLVNGMITNFHQPQSTLLLLVAAFLGPGWKETYEYALKNDFRFLSYGDSNLYLKG